MRSLLWLVGGTLAIACVHGSDAGVPLYPDAATMPLPRSQLAQVGGPIAKIDGRDVSAQGELFDLLPGCHVVEVDKRPPANFSLSSATYWTGSLPTAIYALRMKPGARYLIRRDIDMDGSGGGRVALSAREQEASGAVNDLTPAQSADELDACKAWEATLAPGRRG